MKIKSLANFNGSITIDKNLRRIMNWRNDDILQAVYDDKTEILKIMNVSKMTLKFEPRASNFISVKIYEAMDFWNALSGNSEVLTLELEKQLRVVIITNHLADLKEDIKTSALNRSRLKGKNFLTFLKEKKIVERYLSDEVD